MSKKDYLYKAAVAEVALAMYQIIDEVRKQDPKLSLIANLESGKLKREFGTRIAVIDGHCEKIIERFSVTSQELEDDIAIALHQFDAVELLDKRSSLTIH